MHTILTLDLILGQVSYLLPSLVVTCWMSWREYFEVNKEKGGGAVL